MEKILKQILTKLDGIESKVNELYERKDKIDELYERKDKIDESYAWLSAMHHSNQVHKAEIDQINHQIATIEGALTGVADSLEPLKKAQ